MAENITDMSKTLSNQSIKTTTKVTILIQSYGQSPDTEGTDLYIMK